MCSILFSSVYRTYQNPGFCPNRFPDLYSFWFILDYVIIDFVCWRRNVCVSYDISLRSKRIVNQFQMLYEKIKFAVPLHK